ncbi:MULTISPECIES: TIGR01777 family oxidoreductase [unclassified Colwellia]|uniref:TIGR01777 family oxidoreductase n=1 Tax=unclassified Colwellia TaxID=196834 RepID=UPI0015F5C824|nr:MULTISPECIES: TIGR01777 family oxidoreductase [unclassified Colwellia]MBA6233863.1 TIGR01777 family protein [Colwellia sp. MB02u-7]MBA6237321.1 TIGR01777 family protein [Colwellia sp. MB02u-11]MBA6256396.1 TIGR01777 family protein [Colwellia sp. MB3u-28]MBA6260402.1 TIGR01777 family protein [Colwellia sp. MB3u-41]MBA6300321.1 TIGR01777 family protein [Colwellia sp. MB3u-22]
MNFLITGGTGLIGQALIKSINFKDNTVTVLTRNIATASLRLTNDINFIDELSLSDIEHSDIVINLAGEPIADKRWTREQKNKICDSRWNITAQITHLISIAQKPPRVLISGSAIGIYGRQNDMPIDEDFSDFHQEFTHDVCAKWEENALAAISAKTRVAILRTGIVLDRESGALAKMILPFKLGVGGKISHGGQFMSWIHLEDMVSAIIYIIGNNNLSGPINMTSPNAATNETFSKALAKSLHRPCILMTPAPLLKLIFGEMAELLLFGQNVVPQKLLNNGFTFKHSDIGPALTDLLK